MLPTELTEPARRVGTLLRTRGETVAVAEGSAGGLVSAALLSVPGASAYYLGGAVVYTVAAVRAWMAASRIPDGSKLPAAGYVETQGAPDRELYMAHCLQICGVCLQCGEQVPVWHKNLKLPKNRVFLHRQVIHSSQREMETGLWTCPLRELGPS